MLYYNYKMTVPYSAINTVRHLPATRCNRGAWAMDLFEPTIEYRPIPDFPGYHLGSDGSVWSSNQHPLVKYKPPRPWHQIAIHVDAWGYQCVNLHNGTTRQHRTKGIHILMLEVFVGSRPPGMYALHKNDIRTDNRLENLYWGTKRDNARDAITNRRMPHGPRHHNTKLSDDDVREIRRRVAAGESLRAVAHAFGIGRTHTGAIARRKERLYVE